jgi:hypothetical protein
MIKSFVSDSVIDRINNFIKELGASTISWYVPGSKI